MSFLTYRTPLLLRSAFAPQARAFGVSTRWMVMGESDVHSNHENHKEKIDSHKHDSLNKQKDGKGHWKGELASDSESAVKADRGEVNASEENISKLQKESEEYLSTKKD